MEIPQEVQKDLINFRVFQAQLGTLQAQRARIEAELAAVSEAIEALERSEDEYAYKAVGTVLVKEKREVILSELKERKEGLEVRKKGIEKKEQQLQTKLVELKKKIESALTKVGEGAAQGG